MSELTPEHVADIKKLRRAANKARNFPTNTCPASRHLHIMADCLLKKRPQIVVKDIKSGATHQVRYWMLLEEPEHCAETMLAVLASLWEARTRLAKLEKVKSSAASRSTEGR